MEDTFGYDSGIIPVEEATKDDDKQVDNNGQQTSLDNDGVQYDENGNPITKIDGADDDNKDDKNNDSDSDNSDKEKLEVGTELQVDDKTYKVDENGNIVDEEGNIFKEAKDVKDWLAQFDQQEETNEDEINIQNLQKALDIIVTDENDKEIEFPNTVSGIKEYVEQVIESGKEEHFQIALTSLFERYPFVQDMINYYNANGQSLEGYGQVPDRSNITIDENDEAQQEYIIRTAWKEQNKKGVDGYIQYLKSTGNLLTVAKEELEALKESDKEYRETIKKQAEAAEKQKEEESKQFWGNVQDIIKSRSIAGYNIPESIVVERNGRKMSATPQDFFNYIYQVDDSGKSRYDYDRESETFESRLNDFILKAYLKFTGGSYSNLVDMAINKKEVGKLILKSKENKKPSISVRKPTATKKQNIDLGYK